MVQREKGKLPTAIRKRKAWGYLQAMGEEQEKRREMDDVKRVD